MEKNPNISLTLINTDPQTDKSLDSTKIITLSPPLHKPLRDQRPSVKCSDGSAPSNSSKFDDSQRPIVIPSLSNMNSQTRFVFSLFLYHQIFIDNYYTLSALVLFVLLQLDTLGWVFYKAKKNLTHGFGRRKVQNEPHLITTSESFS